MPIIYRESEAWPASRSRDEMYIVGDETTAVGDEQDSAVEFFRLLFGNPLPFIRDIAYLAATIQRREQL